MNLRNNFAVLLVGLSCLFINTNSKFRIVKGRSSNIADSPYIVSLHIGGKHKCGGSLVTMRIVITAAHCLKYYKAKEVIVVAGVTYLSQPGQSRIARRLYIPFGYSRTTNNMDVGAIKVRTPFIPGPLVQAIQLCNTELKLGTKMQISGWGATNPKIIEATNTLQTANVPIVSTRDCASRYGVIGRILTKTMICAGSGGTDTCGGDSGGPGVVKGRLCAVVSWGAKCGDPYFAGVYTNVNNAKVLKFIKKAMKK
ncbi:hypodermin-A-like [Eurosta solidaginis]|uniref:hypodermin-A-like n=1 Tax=Eurosta solidaginis TaxID=178769 RepID=UPI0035305E60